MTPDPLGPTAAPSLDLDAARLEVRRFLQEDVGPGDETTRRTIPPDLAGHGTIVAREAVVVAGLDLARLVFEEVEPRVRFSPLVAEGTLVDRGTPLVSLDGPIAGILTGERVALNLLQRLSGIATLTRRYVDAIAGTGATVSDTRKTTPGLRRFEKYAVRVGGGRNHRIGLFDAVLIKDNHVAACGGIAEAMAAVTSAQGPRIPVQIEVDSLTELSDALAAGATAVLLDNMAPSQIAAAVRIVRAHPNGAACWIEASGGITLRDIRAYAQAGVDTISVGALTHSSPSVDIALDLDPATKAS